MLAMLREEIGRELIDRDRHDQLGRTLRHWRLGQADRLASRGGSAAGKHQREAEGEAGGKAAHRGFLEIGRV
jgi:hypothetical protein